MPRGNGGPVRLSDVAREAGVSLGTVSNTLNRPHSVSELTRNKVLALLSVSISYQTRVQRPCGAA